MKENEVDIEGMNIQKAEDHIKLLQGLIAKRSGRSVAEVAAMELPQPTRFDALQGYALEAIWFRWDLAPKDGREILVWFEDGRKRITHWGKTGDSSYPETWKTDDGGYLIRPWNQDWMFQYWTHLPASPIGLPEEFQHKYEEYDDEE